MQPWSEAHHKDHQEDDQGYIFVLFCHSKTKIRNKWLGPGWFLFQCWFPRRSLIRSHFLVLYNRTFTNFASFKILQQMEMILKDYASIKGIAIHKVGNKLNEVYTYACRVFNVLSLCKNFVTKELPYLYSGQPGTVRAEFRWKMSLNHSAHEITGSILPGRASRWLVPGCKILPWAGSFTGSQVQYFF